MHLYREVALKIILFERYIQNNNNTIKISIGFQFTVLCTVRQLYISSTYNKGETKCDFFRKGKIRIAKKFDSLKKC